jgi:transposase-like protein
MAINWMAPAPGLRWTAAEGSAAVRAWKRSGLTLEEFARQHEVGLGKLSWWKRRLESRRARAGEPITLAPVVATVSSAAVVVRVGEVEIEVRAADLVSADWLATVVAGVAAARRGA